MHISLKTTETHQANIKQKLSLKSGQELIRQAILWQFDESKYQALFYNLPQGICYLLPDEVVVDCNDKLLELFDITRDDLLGKTFKEAGLRMIDDDLSPKLVPQRG